MKKILVMWFCLLSLHSYGINYFVSSSKGKAQYSGRSSSRAKQTIQQAADLSKPGDTIFVMNGTYTNQCPTCNVVNVPVSGKPGKYIVYRNAKGHQPKLLFNGWGGFSIRGAISYIKISGFEIIGNNAKVALAQALVQPKSCENPEGELDPKFNGNGIVVDGRNGEHPHHIVISKNIVRDCGGGGISAIQADYITVEDNVVYRTSWYSVFGTSGISFYQLWNLDEKKGYHNIIRRNRCYANQSLVPAANTCKIEDGNGIIIDDSMNKQGSSLGAYTGLTLIENNLCWYNGGTGIHTFQSSYVDILNNTAYRNSQSTMVNAGEILASASTEIRMVNNILVAERGNRINSNYQNSAITYENNLHFNIDVVRPMELSITSATCVIGDPLFIRPLNALNADFSLIKGSPAVKKGNTSLFSLFDFYGRKRKPGEVDIGAIERN